MTRLWIVRAGRQGERETAAIEQSRLLPGFGWFEIGDLKRFPDREAILAHLEQLGPDDSRNRLQNFAAQMNQFVHTIQISDLVMMPRKLTNGVAIGEVTGDYCFRAGDELHCRHSRPVKWHKDSVPRDTFKQDLRHSLGAGTTICEIKRNAALTRVQAILKTGTDPGAVLQEQGRVVASTSEEKDYAVNIEEIAHQQIAALLKTEFAGHLLADLVSEILRIEGYTTKVSPPGPDQGVDILAAGGTLGLGEDRICIQIKSGEGPANHDVVLRLLGSVANTQAQTGLLVSMGGVTGPAQKELERNFFKLRLWQMPDLLQALFRSYANLSDGTRAKLPLKQIWTAIMEDET